jgi:CARDB
MKKSAAPGLALALALLATSAAHASPVTLTFDHVVLDTPATPKLEVVTSAAPMSVAANLDQASGDFTIAPADFHFPAYTLTTPVRGTANLSLAGPASGHVDFASGLVTLTGRLAAKVTVPILGSCTITTMPLTLSTASTSPLAGRLFPTGPAGLATGPGALAGSWSSLPAGSGSACGAVGSALGGAGGVWLSKGIAPGVVLTGAPSLRLTVAKPRRAKAGRKVTVPVQVANTGALDATAVAVCVKAPRRLGGKTCKGIGMLAAGASRNVRFAFRTRKGAAATYALKFTAAGSGLASAKQTVKLRTKR